MSWNYLHDHWKSSLVGNDATFRDLDSGHLHVTYHHNHWRNSGTRGPAGRFGHQHVYNNLYEDFRYQAIHSRSDNQVLVEGNVFRGDLMGEALSTYGLVIPMDSPNTCECGDEELDGFANLGAGEFLFSLFSFLGILAKEKKKKMAWLTQLCPRSSQRLGQRNRQHHPGWQLYQGTLRVQADAPGAGRKGGEEWCWYRENLRGWGVWFTKFLDWPPLERYTRPPKDAA